MKVTEVKVGQVWKNYKTKVEKSVASVAEDEAMMDDMKYIPIKTLLAGKSWKCISDDAVAHEKENKSAKEVADDGTPYSEVMEEIVADEQSLVDHYTKKPKKEKKADKKAPTEKAEKANKPKKAKREKQQDMNTLGILTKWLDDNSIFYKYNDGKYLGVYADSKKAIMAIYKRRAAIRIYTKSEIFDRLKDEVDLYELKGPATKNLDVSLYVNYDNIEKAMSIMLKEEK